MLMGNKGLLTNIPGTFAQHFQVIFSQCDTAFMLSLPLTLSGHMENQIINNDRCKKIWIFMMLWFGAPMRLPQKTQDWSCLIPTEESKHC